MKRPSLGWVLLALLVLPTIARADITNGLVLYLPLDETNGFTAFDASGLGNNGSLVSFPSDNSQWTTGRIGGGLKINNPRYGGPLGRTNYLSISNAPSLNFDTNLHFTIAAWVNLPTAQMPGAAFVAKGSGGGEQYDLDVYGTKFRIVTRPTYTNAATLSTLANIQSNQWQHIAAAWNGINKSMSLYINGQLDHATTNNDLGAVLASTTAVMVGARYSGTVGHSPLLFLTNAILDEVRIYKRTLTPTDVQQLYSFDPNRSSPTIAISNPLNGAAFVAPANVAIVANATETNGIISAVQFYAGTNVVGTVTNAPFNIAWSNMPAGSYSLTAKVTDGLGATALSSPVNITITNVNFSTPLRVATMAGGPKGKVAFQIFGPMDQLCIIQCTTNLPHGTNLAAWSPVATNILTGGLSQFIETQAPNYGKRFYRAAIIPPQILESASAMILASSGGSITLPSGSLVNIPPAALMTNTIVTLSMLSSHPRHPPSGLVQGIGPALALSFSTSAQFSAVQTNLTLVLKLGANAVPGITGAATMADVVDPGNQHFFEGVSGQVDSTNKQVTLSLPTTSIPSLAANAARSVTLGAAQLVDQLYPLTGSILYPGPRFWNGYTWADFPAPPALPPGFDPTKKTLLFVHGMASTVEAAFGSDCGDGTTAMQRIMQAGGYEQAVGFDYDWTQPINTSGLQLSAFLDRLKNAGIQNVDVEAHSEGVAVSLSAGCQNNTIGIQNMALLGGPLTGTDAANTGQRIVSLLLNHPVLLPRTYLAGSALSGLVGTLLNDLKTNSTTMSNIRACFEASRPNTKIVAAGATRWNGSGLTMLGQILTSMGAFAGQPFDGIVPTDGARGVGSGLAKLTPLGPYPISHIELECNANVIFDVASNLFHVVTSPPPILSVSPLTLNFSATQGIDPSSQAFTVQNTGPAGSTLNYSWIYSDGGEGWLGVSGPIRPLGAGDSELINVSARTGTLSSGTHTGTITVSAPAATNSSPQTITVTFTINPSAGPFTLTVNKSGTGNGTVSASPPGPTYTNGTEVTLIATPDADSTFTGWSGAATGTGDGHVTMNANKAVTAAFDNPWVGTWAGTITGTFVSGACNWTGSANFTATITVTNGTISGTATESGVPCFHSDCSINDFESATNVPTGTVSGQNISLSFSGVSTSGGCANQSIGTSFSGTRSGNTITGTTSSGKAVSLSRQ